MRARNLHPTAPTPPSALPGRLDDWIRAGLITPDQGQAIAAHERRVGARSGPLRAVPEPTAPDAPSLVIEALGYLGGVIMLVGAGLLVGLYWSDLPVALRLVLVGVAAVGLGAAGAAVPDRFGAPAGRLRSVLWALAVAATGAFFTVLSVDVLDRTDEDALLVLAPPTALVAAVLWRLRRTWIQQLALLVPVLLWAAATGLRISDSDSSPGIAVWVVGVAWAAMAWGGLLEPREVGVVTGALAAGFGAATMTGPNATDVGVVLGLTTALGLVALALRERDLIWLGAGAVLLLWTAPRGMVAWFPGRMSAALTLLVTGGLLVGAAVWVARHRSTPPG